MWANTVSCPFVINFHIIQYFPIHTATQKTQYICITFVQRLPNVFAVGPTLYKCYTNVLPLLGCADKYVITMSDWIDRICLNPFSVGSSPGIFPDAKTA